CQFIMKSGADLEQARNPSPQDDTASGGFSYSAEYFQQRALPGAVTSDDANDLTLPDLEIDFLEGPKFLDLVALDDISTADQVERLASEIARFTRECL